MGYSGLTAMLEKLKQCTDHEDWVKRMYFGPWRDLNVPPEISEHLVKILDLAAEQAIIQERLRVAAKSEEKV